MSYFLAFLGFVILVILHEAGHFTVAKAVGMRVERFSLFFPPLLVRKKVGETEYAIGALPLGGYVKISGMNPSEDLPDEVRTQAYYAQPPWKRVAVIAAGPGVNFILALVLLWVFAVAHGPVDATRRVLGMWFRIGCEVELAAAPASGRRTFCFSRPTRIRRTTFRNRRRSLHS